MSGHDAEKLAEALFQARLAVEYVDPTRRRLCEGIGRLGTVLGAEWEQDHREDLEAALVAMAAALGDYEFVAGGLEAVATYEATHRGQGGGTDEPE